MLPGRRGAERFLGQLCARVRVRVRASYSARRFSKSLRLLPTTLCRAKETEETKDISTPLIQAKIAKLQKLDLIFPVAYGSYAVSNLQAARIWLRHLGDDLFVESY